MKVHPKNPRYFADKQGRPILLVGSHTWNNLVDMGRSDPPEPFDFEGYLDFLQRHGHNFIRLWTWDSTTWDTRANGRWGKDFIHHVAPQPWLRTGPGKALDGKPKFDLTRFNPAYFQRLRQRVEAAGKRGIYVSVMLFEGWGLMHGNRRRPNPGWAWRTHPFHPANNINGVDASVPGDPNAGQPHRLGNPRVNEIQAAYIKKVVDTVNDLDNVLYEVINEGGEREWDWWVVRTVKGYEAGKAKQHPVGITGHGAEDLKSMLASPADWISPGSRDGFREDPPAWDGRKVSILDTDHIWGIGGSVAWVWRAFLRGHNPIFMDPYKGTVLDQDRPRWHQIRKALGIARNLSTLLELERMEPHDELSSSRWCLADPGRSYVVLVPAGTTVKVDLKHGHNFRARWIDAQRGSQQDGGTVPGGGKRQFRSPFRGDGVLWLKAL